MSRGSNRTFKNFTRNNFKTNIKCINTKQLRHFDRTHINFISLGYLPNFDFGSKFNLNIGILQGRHFINLSMKGSILRHSCGIKYNINRNNKGYGIGSHFS